METRGFSEKGSTEAGYNACCGRGERRKQKNENCAPKPHAARRMYLSDDMWRKSVLIFLLPPGWHCKSFRSAFFRKSLSFLK
ncbi:UNVERIFIED_CONTAM: hypothetical protein ABID98_003595 [Brevibacillus sp. OAP136]